MPTHNIDTHAVVPKSRWRCWRRGGCSSELITAALVATAVAAMGVVEYAVFGAKLVPENEPLKLWHHGWGSQHVLDGYSVTHLQHGMLCFLVHKALCQWYPRWRAEYSILLGAACEITWELHEASPGGRAGYGEVYDYKGDTVVNSMADVACMLVGLLIPLMWISTYAAVAALWVAIDAVSLYIVADTFLINHLWAMLPREVLHRYLGPMARWQEQTWLEMGE